MLFWIAETINKNRQIKEKEKDSFLVPTNIIQTIPRKLWDCPRSAFKRALLCTCKRKKASVTVEASIIIPVFLFGVLCLMYLLEILAIQMSVRSAVHEVGYEFGTANLYNQLITNNQMEEKLIEVIGEERLEGSIIVDGDQGLDLSQSQINYATGVVQLQVGYKVELPIPYFVGLDLNYSESLIFKR